MITQLLRARFGNLLHFILRAEMQTPGRAGLDTGRFKALPHAVGAERAFVNLLGGRIELRNVEGAARNAILAADAILLIEIHDAVGVLHNRAISRARAQTPRISAMHALIFAHQPLERAIIALVLIEL